MVSTLSRRLGAACAAASIALASAGPIAAREPRPDPPVVDPVTVPRLAPGPRRLLLVMIDGLPVGAFDAALDAGAMPRLRALLDARPTVRAVALSTFPSATSPSLPEALSGRYAGLSNVEPGAVHAFDRERRRVVRYLTEPDAWDWPVPNLFDAARAAGLETVTVFEGRWDGPRSIVTRGSVVLDAALEAVGIERYNGDREPVEKLLRRLAAPDPPAVVLMVFNAVDLAGHFHGPGSPEERQALVRTDALLGRLLGAFETRRDAAGRSLLDDTTVVLFGDHGMVPSGGFVDLDEVLERRGLHTFDASTLSQVVFRERLGRVWTRWPDAILVAGGSNVTQIYLREPNGGWSEDGPQPSNAARKAAHRPDVAALARDLAEVPGVAQVVRPLDGDRIEILAPGGRSSEIVARGEGRDRVFAYVVPDGVDADPFDYLADPTVAPWVCREGAFDDGCFRGRDAWLDRTASARFPGAVGLLDKALRPSRFTGDLVVTARRGYTFLKGQHGDHGDLEADAMTTPLVINGPGVVPGCRVSGLRLVDLYPTAAVLLGADRADPVLEGLDGRPSACVDGP